MTQPPPPNPTAYTLALPDEAATARVAAHIATHARAQQRLHLNLHGDLGAGKTTLVRHVLRALGVQGRIKSPTYALVETYEIDGLAAPACHFDLYRLQTPEEWLESGLQEELQAPGLRLVEWPEKAGGNLPAPDASLYLQRPPAPSNANGQDGEEGQEARELRLVPNSLQGAQLAQRILDIL